MMQNNPQYPQQAGIYQQPMINVNPPPQGFIPVQQDITLGPGPVGRQDLGGAKPSGLQKLDEQPGIFIKQKFELGELVLGCETRNRYHVYALNDDGNKKGRQLFKAKENSGFCTRFCLSGDCRPFNMNIESTIRGEEENAYEPFLHLERPCKCTCLCFNRPELKIYLVQGGGQSEYIGKIVDPWNCCNLEMDVYDKNNIMKYSVVGSCCQLGIWCQCPCESCQTIDFEVRSGSEVVSHMQKRTPGCLKAAVTDLDNFSMKFPMNATAIDKALLMSAIIMLDYRHFERNPNENNG